MEGNSVSKGKGLKSLFRFHKSSMSVTSLGEGVYNGAPGAEGSGWGGRPVGLEPDHKLLIPERRLFVIL